MKRDLPTEKKERKWWNPQVGFWFFCTSVLVLHFFLQRILLEFEVISNVFAAGSHLSWWILPCIALFAGLRLLALLVIPGLIAWRVTLLLLRQIGW